MTYDSKRIVLIPSDSIEQMYKETGHKEGTTHHKALEHKIGFSYQTLLGEVMYAYITCQSDIGYTVATCAPSEYHYKLLKMVAKYSQTTAH